MMGRYTYGHHGEVDVLAMIQTPNSKNSHGGGIFVKHVHIHVPGTSYVSLESHETPSIHGYHGPHQLQPWRNSNRFESNSISPWEGYG